ncbi:hypothetical protein D9M72_272260 [compost metagenome]
MLLGLGLEVGDVHVAAGVAGGHYHAHAGHGGGGGVGAVGGGGDQADVALVVAAAAVIGADRQQAGVLALGTGVGLQGHGVIAGGLTQHGFQLAGQLQVALGLLGRGEGVQGAELGPGDGDHFAGGVQLHGAGAQRDHAAVQRQILVGQLAQVAHQLGFRVVAVEHRVAEDRALAQQGGRQAAGDPGGQFGEDRQGLAVGEQRPELLDVSLGGGFVQRQAEADGIHLAQVEALGAGQAVQLGGAGTGGQGQGVEEVFLLHGHAQLAQALGEDRGQLVHAPGDAGQALRAVVHGVHAGDVGQQHLGGADVAGGLFAADVLLAGLHGQAQGRLAVAIDGDADQAARHVALERVAGGEVGRVRATEAQRHAEALGAAEGDVGTELAGRGQQGQGQQVGGHGDQGADGVEALHQLAVVVEVAVAGGVLQQGAEVGAGVAELTLVADHHLDAQRLGAGAQHVEGLRVAVLRGEEGVAGLVLAQALAEGHGLGGGSAFVEQGGVGDRQAGEVADQGLEVQQRFQAALGDFRLVGGIGGVPGRVFQQVAQDRAGGVAGVVALADVVLEQLVLRGDGLDRGEGFGLALAGRQVEHAGALDAVGHHAGDHRLQAVEAEQVQHGVGVDPTRTDVARDELVARVQGELGEAHGGSSGQAWSARNAS